MPAQRPSRKPRLWVEQWEIVRQMNDAAFDNPAFAFEQTAVKVGARFSDTPEGRLLRKECRKVFHRERDKPEYVLEHGKFLVWQREAYNRLYYGFWIMFLGGFVLSLRVTPYRHFGLASILIEAFRFLAILGTVVNFRVQQFSIIFLSGARELFLFKTMGREDSAETASKKINTYVPLISHGETFLQIMAASFLLIAFGGSFLVRVS
jgi:hypothetical protein